MTTETAAPRVAGAVPGDEDDVAWRAAALGLLMFDGVTSPVPAEAGSAGVAATGEPLRGPVADEEGADRDATPMPDRDAVAAGATAAAPVVAAETSPAPTPEHAGAPRPLPPARVDASEEVTAPPAAGAAGHGAAAGASPPIVAAQGARTSGLVPTEAPGVEAKGPAREAAPPANSAPAAIAAADGATAAAPSAATVAVQSGSGWFIDFDDALGGKGPVRLDPIEGDGAFALSALSFGFGHRGGSSEADPQPDIAEINFTIDGVIDPVLQTTAALGQHFGVDGVKIKHFGGEGLTSELLLTHSLVTSVATVAANGALHHAVTLQTGKAVWSTQRTDGTGDLQPGGKTELDIGPDNDPAVATYTPQQDGLAPTGLAGLDGPAGSGDLKFFMRVTGAGQTNWVEIDAFSYAIENTGSIVAGGGGGGAGKTSFTQLGVLRAADDASPLFAHLAETEATGGRIEIQVFADRSGTAPAKWVPVADYVFANIAGTSGAVPLVAETNIGGRTEDGRLAETLVLNFTEIREETKPVSGLTDEHGGAANSSHVKPFLWSTAKNKAEGPSEIVTDAPVDSSTGALPPPAGGPFLAGETDFFLKIDGIDGPSDDVTHYKTFELGTFTLDADARTLTVALPAAGELAELTGKATGTGTQIIPSIELFAKGQSGADVKLKLETVLVKSLETNFDSSFTNDDGVAVRIVTFDFRTLSWEGGGVGGKLVLNALAEKSSFPTTAPVGGRYSLSSEPEGFANDQRAYMKVSLDGGGGETSWIEIDDFDVNWSREIGLNQEASSPTLDIQITRVIDDASPLLAAMMAEGATLDIDLEVWDSFGAPEEWAGVADYDFDNVRIVGIENAGVQDGGFATEKLQIQIDAIPGVFDGGIYEEQIWDGKSVSGPGGLPDLSEFSSASYDFGAGVSVTPGAPLLQADIDTETGELNRPDPPLGGSDALVNYQTLGGGGSGLRLFLQVEGVDSGDGELNVAFDAFDDWFIVDGFEFAGASFGDFAAFSGISLTIADHQNWAALDALAAEASDGDNDPGNFQMRLVAVDKGPAGSPGNANVVWEIATDAATLFAAAKTSELRPGYELDLGADFEMKVREDENGSRTGSQLLTGTFDETSGQYTVTGLDPNDPEAQGGFGDNWYLLLDQGNGVSGEYRYALNLSGNDAEEWMEIESFFFDPIGGTLTITRRADSDSVYHAYLAGTGAALTDHISLEAWSGFDQYNGLVEYVFKDGDDADTAVGQIVEQYITPSGAYAVETLVIAFDEYQEIVADYDVLGQLQDLDPARGFASDDDLDLALFGFDTVTGGSSFDGLSNPVRRTMPSSGPTSALPTADDFASIAAAIEAASPGDTIEILDANATDYPGPITVDVADLVFDIAPGLGLVLVLDDAGNFVTIANAGTADITGSGIADTITGGDGGDTIDGGAGNDSILGGAGDDLLRDGDFGASSSQGFDTLLGGEGDDTIDAGFADVGDVFDGGAGNDTLILNRDNFGFNIVLGGPFTGFASFDDFENVIASRGNDTITGSADANVIDGEAGNDTVSAGDGNDTVTGGAGNDFLQGGAGDDLLTDDDGAGGIDTLLGGDGDDTIVVASAQSGESYDGGADTDTLDLSGEDKAYAGANAIDLSAASFAAHGASFAGFESVVGSALDDDILGSDGANLIEGGDGDDTIEGGDGNDTILGGGGNDTIIDGTPNNGRGFDSIDAGEGDDKVVVFAAAGGEVFDGGAGTDTLELKVLLAYNVDLSGPDAEFTYFATFRNFENVIGSDQNDTITGSDGANTLNGGAGADLIDGGGGDDLIIDDDGFSVAGDIDTIDGGAGDDTIRVVTGGSGNIYDGGEGTDLIDLRFNVDEFSGAEAIDLSQAFFANGADTYHNFENAIGSVFGDDIIGSDGANVLDGHSGADSIHAGAGDDTIIDRDNDNDVIDAGDGDDLVIVHGAQGDTYEGGANGAGGDTLDLSNETKGYLAIDLDAAFFSNGMATFSGFENVIGTAFDDDITGSDGRNVINGGGGSDFIDAGGGDDEITDFGIDGIDTIYGGAGSDHFNVLWTNAGEIFDGDDFVVAFGPTAAAAGDVDVLDLSSHAFEAEVDLSGAGDVVFRNFEVVIGSGFADDIRGTFADETLRGGGGRDTIDGGAGDDEVEGGAGSDSLTGGLGTNTLSYAGSAGGVIVNLLDETAAGGDAEGDVFTGFTHLVGSVAADVLTGDGSGNAISGGDGDDTLDGGAGDDVLTGGVGGDAIDGGTGNDTASYAGSDAGVSVVLGGAATGGHADGDVLVSIENLMGSGHADSLSGDGGDNELHGLDGNDTLEGGAGADTLLGGAGNDLASYAGSAAGVVIGLWNNTASGGDAAGDSLSGIERLLGSSFNDTLVGDSANNALFGADGHDSLHGGQGNDTLLGGAGNDTLFGAQGADRLVGGAGNDLVSYAGSSAGVVIGLWNNTASGGDAEGDTILEVERVLGSSHDDSLTGDSGNNALFGADGNDILHGGQGDDALFGGAGKDTLTGALGSDLLDGGGGVDTASYAGSSAGVQIGLWNNRATGGHAAGDTLVSIENLVGSSHADNLAGNSGANLIEGGAGNDSLLGGNGNDRLIGGTGADAIDGGGGVDTASYAGSSAGVQIGLWNNTATGGHAAGDTLVSIENLVGSSHADELAGNAGANALEGGAGDDTLFGGNGNDVLTGGAGADLIGGGGGGDYASYAGSSAGVQIGLWNNTATGGDAAGDILVLIENLIGSSHGDELAGDAGANVLLGGNGNDTLFGGNGSDTLNGGNGNDILVGGGGADVFVFNTGLNAVSNVDAITDFAVGVDDIWLENAVFTGLAAGALAPGAFHIGSAANDALDRIIYDSGTGDLFFDADGSGAGAQIRFATLNAGLALTAADFAVV